MSHSTQPIKAKHCCSSMKKALRQKDTIWCRVAVSKARTVSWLGLAVNGRAANKQRKGGDVVYIKFQGGLRHWSMQNHRDVVCNSGGLLVSKHP